MRRFSLLWWLVVLPTSVVVGGSTFLLAGLLTEWGLFERLVAALALTIIADVAIAMAIQAVAPTKVSIGPGERTLESELPSETARILSGFESSYQGRVLVRGESWRAARTPDDTARLTRGMNVNVVGRDGLMLLVRSAN